MNICILNPQPSQASLRAPKLVRARASLLSAQSLRANAAVFASGMLNQVQ